MSPSPYAQHLDKTPANHQPLTPLSFLERAAATFPAHPAVVHGGLRFTYRELYCPRAAPRLGAGRARHRPGPTPSPSCCPTPRR